ncbi:MAG: ABC transporter permease subunit [Deltaproteobacteria bacterium]|jgi:NitT/TauT family transport system permease protein|nr:ABC transporter permease subunit [Deltaproteobacteria bacterium]
MLRKTNIWLPVLSAAFAFALEFWIEDSPRHPAVEYPYFLYLLAAVGVGFSGAALLSSFNASVRARLEEKALFYSVLFLALTLLNLATKKFALLPVIFFPSLDRIINVLVEDRFYLLVDCLGSSGKLLALGFFSGALAGLITGVSVGFSKSISYWVNPIIKALGPIPPTAWIPIVLVAFPTTFAGGVFLIALSVWFPTAIMTSSGIQNVQNAYFEVSSTLGAGRFYQIFRVGIPAAMPFIFIGIFSGVCASFITLMTAEMIGVKNGIGWYINWQREMLSYANVYAGLIIIAVTFYTLITLLFKVRDSVLVWQKGVIKW